MFVPKKDVDKKILVVGDLHGIWRHLNFLITKIKPEKIFQVGDFGWWPKFHKTTQISSGEYRTSMGFPGGFRIEKPWNQFGIRHRGAKLYFCPGNHEDWEDLDGRATSVTPNPVEVSPNIFFMPRCSVLKLEDGRNILFMGGGHSIDRSFRVPGRDWFPNENITQKDIQNLPDIDISIVISHVGPTEFKYEINREVKYNSYDGDNYDPNCDALSIILEKYRPSLWFFGHYHLYYSSIYRNTKWYCLNKVGETGWWTYLPIKGDNDEIQSKTDS